VLKRELWLTLSPEVEKFLAQLIVDGAEDNPNLAESLEDPYGAGGDL